MCFKAGLVLNGLILYSLFSVEKQKEEMKKEPAAAKRAKTGEKAQSSRATRHWKKCHKPMKGHSRSLSPLTIFITKQKLYLLLLLNIIIG